MLYLRNLFLNSFGILLQEAILLALIIISSFLIKFIVHKIFKQLHLKRGKFVHSSFKKKILRPLYTLIWVTGLSYMIYVFIVRIELQNNFSDSFTDFRNVILVLCMAWLFFEVKKQTELYWMEKLTQDETSTDSNNIEMLSKLATIFIIFLTLLIVLASLGVNINALVTFGGVGGLVFGLASKDILSNYFSGFMIYMTKPFKKGDLITIVDLKVIGTVERIGYYATQVRGLDKRLNFVPNSIFPSKVVTNISKVTSYRLDQNIMIRYQDFGVLEDCIQEIKKMVEKHESVVPKEKVSVTFGEFGRGYLNIVLFCFVHKHLDRFEVQQDILFKIGKILHKHKAEIAPEYTK